MRIALFPDDYLPTSTLVHAKMFHELALELNRKGHHAIIITPSQRNDVAILSKDIYEGVEVWRFRNPPTRGVSKTRRAVNETMLSFNCYRAIKNELDENPIELCINWAPTIFFGPLLIWIKKRHKTINYLVLRDMFPQWAIDEGLIRQGSIIELYFRFFEHINYRSSDMIGLMSQENVNYFSSLHGEKYQTEVLHNWASLTPFSGEISVNIRERIGISDDVVLFFYGGNIGHAQDMANLMRLANSMKEDETCHFLFVGQGDEFPLVRSLIDEWNLKNVSLFPSVSQSVYKELLTQVDVGLFSLARSHKAHNFPGKLLGYMVESLPILGSVNPGNDLVHYINNNGAGLVYLNGDDDALLNAAKLMANSKIKRKEFGLAAYKTLCDYFSVSSAADKILNTLGQDARNE